MDITFTPAPATAPAQQSPEVLTSLRPGMHVMVHPSIEQEGRLCCIEVSQVQGERVWGPMVWSPVDTRVRSAAEPDAEHVLAWFAVERQAIHEAHEAHEAHPRRTSD
jgi:hypothetical protein